MNFPCKGTIYLKQNLKFLKPMFVDNTYIKSFEVIDHLIDKHRTLIKTEIYNTKGKVVVTGEASIQNNKYL